MDLWWGQYGVLWTDIIDQYLLYYMSNVYGWHPLVYGYIYCQIVFNNLLPFPVLLSGAWCYYCDIILSYYDIRYHDSTSQQYQAVRDIWKEGHYQLGLSSTKVTFLSNNSTIWCHNNTIWRHNNTIWRHNSIL